MAFSAAPGKINKKKKLAVRFQVNCRLINYTACTRVSLCIHLIKTLQSVKLNVSPFSEQSSERVCRSTHISERVTIYKLLIHICIIQTTQRLQICLIH